MALNVCKAKVSSNFIEGRGWFSGIDNDVISAKVQHRISFQFFETCGEGRGIVKLF